MISQLAHITPVEAPAGVLMFLAGFACGGLAVMIMGRLRTN